MEKQRKEEKEVIREFLKKANAILNDKHRGDSTADSTEKGNGTIREEWSENKYNFMKKYGHI